MQIRFYLLTRRHGYRWHDQLHVLRVSLNIVIDGVGQTRHGSDNTIVQKNYHAMALVRFQMAKNIAQDQIGRIKQPTGKTNRKGITDRKLLPAGFGFDLIGILKLVHWNY